METEHVRNLWWKLFFNVLFVLFSFELDRVWRAIALGTCELHSVQNLWPHQYLEVSVVGSSIPVIGNVTSIHDLSVNVNQISIGNLVVLSQVIMKHISANPQVTIIEIVDSRPSLRSELSSS
jgi:hypothetical protein